ncbi:response regulator [Siccirubricoccus sp. KC 17139]|uniref:Response regulator n=1 Tax=Siccirubricoccus soli TaxID=2899147 RepID=A0ABT1DC61_9PROT|nr:response regulator [Siccirubricoccus soli]MCO6419525.1 response regulator [Siccirubricoccus soli]MCP2685660.1 response regulator [Siccirubricoccus soli]
MRKKLPVLLVVEDDVLVRLTLVDALSDDGFDVLDAADAHEAMQLISKRMDISALLTDINLPGGEDGFALARAVRQVRPELPVIYASGRYAGVPEAQTVGGARFLAKPFSPTLATEAIRELLAKRKVPDPACRA